MSNPIGYSDNWPAGIDQPSGLILSTTPATSVDPDIEVNGDGAVYYYRPEAPETLTDGGPNCSPTPRDAVGLSGALYPYVQFRETGSFDQSQTSDIAATDAAGAAAGTLVTVAWSISVSILPGYVHCDPAHVDPITMTVEALTMGGSIVPFTSQGVELQVLPRSTDSLPTYVVTASTVNEFSDVFYLLRRPALHWPGQDPNNIGNRIFWNPSEIGQMGYRVHGLGRHLSVIVDWKVEAYGPTTFPRICANVAGPGVINATPSGGGIRPRGWRPAVTP